MKASAIKWVPIAPHCHDYALVIGKGKRKVIVGKVEPNPRCFSHGEHPWAGFIVKDNGKFKLICKTCQKYEAQDDVEEAAYDLISRAMNGGVPR